MPSYDWDKMRREYLSDPSMSFRRMCKKYNVPLSTLQGKAKKEKWYEKRIQLQHKADAKCADIVVSKTVSATEAIMEGVEALAVKALMMSKSDKVALGPKGMHDLANTLQILAKLMGIQSAIDEQEQKARIASIEARAGVQEEDEGGGAILIPEKGWDDDE